MNVRAFAASLMAVLPILALAPAFANADALSITCAGVPSATSIAWTASSTGGVSPVALLWSNGATTSSQTVSYAPGLQSISLQATDASSTVATTTCSASVAWPKPVIASFIASPASIIAGQSSTLSWNVTGASTTVISGLSSLTGTATTVSPTVTTVYTLTTVNPSGTTTASATVFVTASSTPGSGTLAAQIQALLAQITSLRAQILALLQANGTVTGTTHGHDGDTDRDDIHPGHATTTATSTSTIKLHGKSIKSRSDVRFRVGSKKQD